MSENKKINKDKNQVENNKKSKPLKDAIKEVFEHALLEKKISKDRFNEVINDKNIFLEIFSPWHKTEGKKLIEDFEKNVNGDNSTNDFSWLDILDTDKRWEQFLEKKTEWNKLEDKNKHVNMRYQIPTHFHGNIDNAVIFHCMENPRGYLGEYEDSYIDKGLECTDLVEYFGKTYKLLNEDNSSKKSVEKIQSVLKNYQKDDLPDTKDIIKKRYQLDKFKSKNITNIIYSDKSNLSRELDNLFLEGEDFFEKEYNLKKHKKNKKPVLSEKYYYLAQYYAQLLKIDGKNMRNLKDKRGDENTEERKKVRKIANKICNLEIYPFSCKDPKLGDEGIGEKILLNSDLSRLGAYIVLRRIYKYLINENPQNPQKPLFVFRKYDRAWEKLFNRIFKEVGVEDKFLQYLESHFFYCQTGQQGGGITSGNVISVHDFKALENIYKKLKELAFTEIFNLITEKED